MQTKLLTQLYPLAKGGHNTYNEAYSYFMYNSKPIHLKTNHQVKNWVKNIRKRFYFNKEPLNKQSKSRLIQKSRKNKSHYQTIPYQSEILKS